MKALILSSEAIANEKVVTFQQKNGQGRAIWSSALPIPSAQESIDVELDVNVAIDADAFDTDFEKTKIAVEGELVVLDLVAESQDDDGMTYCRLSNDCLLMIESNYDKKIDKGQKLTLKIWTQDIEITPI